MAKVDNFPQIIQDLSNKVFYPVYFLCGNEPYYIDKITNYIAQNVLDETEKDFNQTILYGKDTNVATIIEHAKRFPMMANQQVVIVKEAQHIKDIDKLEVYTNTPLKSTILVINYKYKVPDGRKSFGKNIKKNALYFESKKLYDNQVPEWIGKYAKSKKVAIDHKSTALLTEFLGNDLSKITNEVDKLCLLLNGEKKEITAALIEKNIGISKDYNNFELNKAMGQKNIQKANEIINYFGKNPNGNPMVVTIGLLYSFFSKVLLYHFTKDKSRNNLASALKVSPYFVQDYQLAANNFNPAKTVKAIEYLRDYDLKSKGVKNSSTPASELMKELIYKILH